MSTALCPFFRLLKDEDKGEALLSSVSRFREGNPKEGSVFLVDPASFRKVPNSPFAYWVDDSIRELFRTLPPFESEGRTVKQGLATADDFRFVRAWWEVPAERRLDAARGPDWRHDLKAFQDWCRRRTHEGKYWVPFAKGGEYSPYYADIHLVVNWRDDGRELDAFEGSVIRNPDFYFRPGLTWAYLPKGKGFFAVLLPGSMFGHGGNMIVVDASQFWSLLAYLNSDVYLGLLHLLMPRGLGDTSATLKYEVGYVRSVSIPSLRGDRADQMSSHAELIYHARRLLYNKWTGSALFDATCAAWSTTITPKSRQHQSQAQVASTVSSMEAAEAHVARLAAELAGLSANDLDQLGELVGFPADKPSWWAFLTGKSKDPQDWIGSTIDTLVGVCLGRWDIRHSTYRSATTDLRDPLAPLPTFPPGGLVNPDGLPATSGHIVSEEWLRARPKAGALPAEGSVKRPTIPDEEYPLRLPWNGILVDDPGHPDDITARVRKVLELLYDERAFSVEQECCTALGVADLREYLRKPAGFFQDHLSRYSRSRRKAPIYWPLSTKSGSYTLWVYYPRLNEGTLYDGVNNYVSPKLEQTGKELTALRVKLREKANSEIRRRLEELTELEEELTELRAELLRVAALPYKPDLDDGVVICAAPLRKLFRLGKWQKEVETHWAALEAGKYDWAHLAYAIWPKRVEEKCRTDRSLAIALGLEHLCTVQVSARKASGTSPVEQGRDLPELHEDEE